MPSAADLQQLFAGVLTPLQLQAQEQARKDAVLSHYAGQSDRPWQFTLEQSLQNLSAALPNSPQNQMKEKAESNELVLKKATQGYSEKVKAGMSTDDAQLSVLGDAIDEFSTRGDWEAISSLAPQYLALQSKKLELAKLKQETATSAATENRANVEAALKPLEVQNTLSTGASTRASQDSTRRKNDFDMAKTEGLNVVDLTDPKAGPVVASIDPVTREATVYDPETGEPKVLKPGQYRDVSKVTGGGSGKPPPAKVANDLMAAGSALDTTIRLGGGFKPSFGGYKVKEAGDLAMALKKNIFGDKSAAADWWSDYQSYANTIRHTLFGSALTATEKAEWEKAAINPGQLPEVIQKNLARQKAVALRAAQKLGKGWTDSYGEEQVSHFMGYGTSDLEALSGATPAPAGTGWSVKKVN